MNIVTKSKLAVYILSTIFTFVFSYIVIQNANFNSLKDSDEFVNSWYNHFLEENGGHENAKTLFKEDLPNFFRKIERNIVTSNAQDPHFELIGDKANYSIWHLKKNKQYDVDLSKGLMVNKPSVEERRVIFSLFIYHLKNAFEIDENDDFEEFEGFSNQILQKLNPQKKYSERFPHLKVFRFYISNDTTIAIYPRPNKNYGKINPLEREWYKAANGKFPSTFKNSELDYKSGLSFGYPDVENNKEVNLVRTFWYSFEKESGEKYYICADFFNDTDQTNLAKTSFLNENLDLLIPLFLSLATLVFLALLFELLIKERWIKFISSNFGFQPSSRYWSPSFERVNRKFVELKGAKEKIMQETSFTQSQIRKIITYNDWKISSANIEVGRNEADLSISNKENKVTTIKVKEVSFDIQEERLTTAFETWSIFYDSTDGEKMEVGRFEIWWQNRILLKDDLEIELVFWNKDYLEYLVFSEVLKSQLEDHLLKSEGDQFLALVDKNRHPSSEEIPEELKNTPIFKTMRANGRDFSKRKVLIKEFKDFIDFYKEEIEFTIKAVCSDHFLKLIFEKESFETILSKPVESRIFVESYEAEFEELKEQLISSIKNNRKEQFNNLLSKLDILKYSDAKSINKLSKYDFALIEKNGKVIYVLYNYDDDTTDAGWVSWRNVDINYYSELYKYITLLKEGRI